MQKAFTTSRPDAPRCSASASTTGNTVQVGWPTGSQVSSKSVAWASTPLAKAASASEVRIPPAITDACGAPPAVRV